MIIEIRFISLNPVVGNFIGKDTHSFLNHQMSKAVSAEKRVDTVLIF
jgi:hypothetical protein